VRRVRLTGVSIFEGRVVQDGLEVAMANRELELTLFLALARAPMTGRTLAQAVWSRPSGKAAAKVYIHRVRAKLGSEAITGTSDGYVLTRSARVDLHQLERFMRSRAVLPFRSQRERSYARRSFGQLTRGRPFRFATWKWFEPTERLLARLAVQLGARLAIDALHYNDAQRCIEVLSEMCTSCVEGNPETVNRVRTDVSEGRKDAALEELERYSLRILTNPYP